MKAAEVTRKWFVVDATDQPLGRLSSRIASVLRGKHTPAYTKNADTGDYVVVINAEKVRLTGNKLDGNKLSGENSADSLIALKGNDALVTRNVWRNGAGKDSALKDPVQITVRAPGWGRNNVVRDNISELSDKRPHGPLVPGNPHHPANPKEPHGPTDPGQVQTPGDKKLPEGARQIPQTILAHLQKLTGNGNAEAWSNTLSLIGKAEQDNLNWWKTASGNSIYGYAEALPYDCKDRGVTIGLMGFTTHDGGKPVGDAQELFDEYRKIGGDESTYQRLKSLSKSANKKHPDPEFMKLLSHLGNDPKWIEAQWNRFIDTDVRPSMNALRQVGIDKPSQLTLAAVIDTSMNQGATGSEGAEALVKRAGHAATEKDFLKHFLEIRKPIAATHDYNGSRSNANHRCQQFLDLLNMGETDLQNAQKAVKQVTSWEMT